MRKGHSGLTLIELIVVLGLLAILATGLFGFYVSGILASQHAQRLAAATGQAQARLEELRSNPVVLQGGEVPPETDSVGGRGYREKTEITPISADLSQVTVTIFWTWRGRERQTSLTTLLRTSPQ